jgi:hypothetical protein
MRARRDHIKIAFGYDCRCLVQFIDDAKLMYDPLGFSSIEAMIREGYELVPEEIDVALEWLRLNPPKEAISFDTAKRMGAREIGIEGGKAGPGRGHKTDVNGARLSKSPHSRAYILARLARDGHTELAAMVRAKMMSANAAAIKAGFRKKPVRLCPKCGHQW